MASLAQSFFLSSLETVINRAVLLDPVAEHKVKLLSGKVLAVHTHTPEIVATVVFSDDSIQIFDDLHSSDQPDIQPEPDASMEGPAIKFASQALRSEEAGIDPGFQLCGDNALVEDIHHIVSTLDVDWEEPLSHFIGDVAAHQVGQIGRQILRWTKRTARTFIADADLFVHEEAHIAPSNNDLGTYTVAVTQLNTKVDQLQNRIDKVQKRFTEKSESLTPTHESRPELHSEPSTKNQHKDTNID